MPSPSSLTSITEAAAPLTGLLADGDRALAVDAALIARATQLAGDLAINLSVAGLIILATWFGSKWAARAARRALGRVRGLKDDKTVEGFVVQVVRVAVIVIGLVAVLQRLGVQTTSIIAVLGAASLAIGLAMQGALSNVAAGVVLLILRPYRVGEVVDIGGMAGVVKRLDLFTTQMSNANNVKIVVPNSQVLSGVIQNISGQLTRRIEIDFTVSYSADLNEAREVIRSTAAGHDKVLGDPPVWTGVTGLLDSAVQITMHAHVLSGDWWQTRADIFQGVKEALDRAGIEIPFPQAVEYFGGNVGAAADPLPEHKAALRQED